MKESRSPGKAALFMLETIMKWHMSTFKRPVSCAVSLPSQEILMVFPHSSFFWGSVRSVLMSCSKTTLLFFSFLQPMAWLLILISVPPPVLLSVQLSVKRNAPARGHWGSSNKEWTSIMIHTRGGIAKLLLLTSISCYLVVMGSAPKSTLRRKIWTKPLDEKTRHISAAQDKLNASFWYL